MPQFVMLSRLTPEAVRAPADLKKLERAVADRIRKDCPRSSGSPATRSWGRTTTWTSSRRPTRKRLPGS